MCGIFAYQWNKYAWSILQHGLQRLEYRGYDSAGIALFDTTGNVILTRSIGKVSELVKKINDNTAWYKYPAWWYTQKFDGWPFSAEWLSAAFDYNVAPFFQSFMEIRVEHKTKQVRFIPYSQHGRLQWKDITSTAGARNPSSRPDAFVEWSIPMQP